MTTYDCELSFTIPADDPAEPNVMSRVTVITSPSRPNRDPERWLVRLHKQGRRVLAVMRLEQGESVSAVLVDGAPLVFHVTHLTGPFGRKGA
jgi:hypothetical protein